MHLAVKGNEGMDVRPTCTCEVPDTPVLYPHAFAYRDALTQAVLDCSTAGFIGYDDDLHIVLCNRSAADLLGVDAPELWHPTSFKQFLAESAHLDADGRHGFEMALRRNTWRDTDIAAGANAHASKLTLLDGRCLRLSAGKTDHGHSFVTLHACSAVGVPSERTDALTGLSDRGWFQERVATMLATAERPDQVSLLLIDLDRFKAVNDSLGHPVGDALLKVVAQRLSSAVREGDVVSRLGGDEFAVTMLASADPEITGQRLVDLLSRPYLVEGHLAVIGASVGIAVGPRDGADSATLIRAADLALYQAKQDGRSTVRKFDQAMDIRARAHHALVSDLRRALALQQFEVHYQPQTSLASREIVGFEALVRWLHPKHGLIPPDQFIPIAEELGLIVAIGEWVLRTACLDAVSWPQPLTVSVNVSAKQLTDPKRLPGIVASALADSGLPPHRLEVEITESALMQQEKGALQVLHALRAVGVRVSMDDFGTGYSSLSQLRSFPFDKLKIDRSFVRDLSNSDEAAAVIRAIAALGASLGMTTTAEGVETIAQEAAVRYDGCTDMQGYLVSRPVPAGEIADLLGRWTAPQLASLEDVR